MYEIQEELEKILNGTITVIDITYDAGIGFQMGSMSHIGQQMYPTSYMVTIILSKHIDYSCTIPYDYSDPTMVLRAASDEVMVMGWSMEQSMNSFWPTCRLSFRVSDMDKFCSDLKNYVWSSFDYEFTKLLDDVLEEE